MSKRNQATSQYQDLKAKRKAYSVDLSGHVQTCELNYHRLLAMLPGLRQGETQWHFEAGEQAQIRIDIELKDQAPYTSLIEVQQQQDGLNLPDLQLRLYHDASVAEVVVFDGHRHWQPKYDYPNPRMYHPDEKLELNRFLRDWLAFCRKHGLSVTNNCDFPRRNAKL